MKPKKFMDEVIPGVFIGSMKAAQDKQLIVSHGITHIICAADYRPFFKKVSFFIFTPVITKRILFIWI